ncbi:MAG: hypothetical protein JRN15_20505 [Nitrososphaerota archaeon]|nr:hypothetical protein [Nitrososphaerota archaeon]
MQSVLLNEPPFPCTPSSTSADFFGEGMRQLKEFVERGYQESIQPVGYSGDRTTLMFVSSPLDKLMAIDVLYKSSIQLSPTVSSAINNLLAEEYRKFGEILPSQVIIDEFLDKETGDQEVQLRVKVDLDSDQALKLWDQLSAEEDKFIQHFNEEAKEFFWKHFSILVEWE